MAKRKAREFEKSAERLKMFRYEYNPGGTVWKWVSWSLQCSQCFLK